MHFTYNEPGKSTLKQGDLLARTDALINLLKEINPYFADEKYAYFQVVTQSCDLVRRGARSICKAEYISIAAVRRLGDVLNKAAASLGDGAFNHNNTCYCNDSHKFELTSFLKKLFNNNEPNYFFLKAEPMLGLNEDSCTCLPLTIPVQSGLHYELCLEAKILELTENFRAKLGWLKGNQFSRVGTEDYYPSAVAPNVEEFNRQINDVLSGRILFIPSKIYSEFSKMIKAEMTEEDVFAHIEKNNNRANESKLSDLVSTVGRVVTLNQEQATELKNTFSQHQLIRKILA